MTVFSTPITGSILEVLAFYYAKQSLLIALTKMLLEVHKK